ncbi:MAG: serine O-acetyltransferase [Armatimonadota bacterium]
MLLTKIWQDIQAAHERDPAARSIIEILLCYSGLHAIIGHRINHRLWVAGLRLFARFNSQVMKFLTGIEIHPGATIGDGFFIDHGAGTVIGETAEIGDGCTLFQGVTLGGTGKESGKRHPTLCDDVTVGAHAQVLGSIRVGRAAVIGAGAVVLDPVPDYATVVGHKAYVIRRNGERVYDFHHENLPRIGAATEELMRRVERLEKELNLPPLEPEQPNCEIDETAEQTQDTSQHTDDTV